MEYDVQTWNSLLANLDALPEHSMIPKMLFTYLQKTIPSPAINTELMGNLFFFNDHVLNLKGRREVRHVFEVFSEYKFEKLDRYFLVRKIYNSHLNNVSIRQREVFGHNIVKLISRARGLAGRAFEQASPKVHWFPYDPASQSWKLYRLSSE